MTVRAELTSSWRPGCGGATHHTSGSFNRMSGIRGVVSVASVVTPLPSLRGVPVSARVSESDTS